MKTVSLKLPDTLANWLEKESTAARRSKSQIVGDLLKARRKSPGQSGSRAQRTPTFHDVMKDYCGKYDGLPADLSTNPGHLEGFGK